MQTKTKLPKQIRKLKKLFQGSFSFGAKTLLAGALFIGGIVFAAETIQYAKDANHPTGAEVLNASNWNALVDRVNSLEANTGTGGGEINYNDCATITFSEGMAGLSCGGVTVQANSADCTSRPNSVLISTSTGLRFPGVCVAAVAKCCRLK